MDGYNLRVYSTLKETPEDRFISYIHCPDVSICGYNEGTFHGKTLQYGKYLALLLMEELKRKDRGFNFFFQPNLKDKEVVRLGSLDFMRA